MALHACASQAGEPVVSRRIPVEPTRAAVAVNAATASSASAAASHVPSPSPSTLPPDAVVADLASRLRPGRDDATLILGVRDEPPDSYAWMFSGDDQPPDASVPGYRTWVVHVRDGIPVVVAELPFLVVPQGSSYVFMGEARAAATEPITADSTPRDGNGEPIPHVYAASSIWTTPDRTQVMKRHAAESVALERARAWGDSTFETLRVVTRGAECRGVSSSTWTGGALAFHGHDGLVLETLPRPRKARDSQKLSRVATDAEMKRAADAIFRDLDGSVDVDLDDPDTEWGMFGRGKLRDELRACLVREGGRVALAGVLDVPGNSARSFDAAGSAGPAPFALDPGGRPLALELDGWQRSIPTLRDAVASKTGAAFALLVDTHLTFYRAPSGQRLFDLPVTAAAEIVLAEWAEGELADRWATELENDTWPDDVRALAEKQSLRALARRSGDAGTGD